MAQVRFLVNGVIDVPDSATPLYAASGLICGYTLANGDVVRPILALEVECDGGAMYRYHTSEKAMSNIGFDCLEYGEITLVPV